MRALVIDKIGNTTFQEVAGPTVGRDEVLLDVSFVGLCGSDLNTFQGFNPLVELPRIPGHEVGGTIADFGDQVCADFAVGRRGIVIPYTTCTHCTSCRKGRFNACQYNKTLGVQQDGALRPQIALKTDRLILNDTLTPRQMALVEPLSVGFHAVARGGVTAQDTVLVLGGGMIGVGAILGAKARGARVIVSEISPQKSKTLEALGVEAVLNPTNNCFENRISELTQGDGPDVIIEAVGAPETFRAAVDLAPFSGRVVYVGYAKSEVSYDTKFFNLKELDIFGSRNATRSDFEAVIAYLEANPDISDLLITRVMPWSAADQALGYWRDNRDAVFKIMIDMEGAR